MSWMMGDGVSPLWMALMFTWMMLFWGTIIFQVVWVVRRLAEPREKRSHADALAVLKERYAKGELSRDEYWQMRQDLEG